MKRILLAAIVLSASAPIAQQVTAPARVVGYFASWGVYARNYHVPNIPAKKITHINFAFANVSNGKIVVGDPYADTKKFYPGDSWATGALRGSFRRLQLLKKANPKIRTLISVGGWTWSGRFSDAVLTAASRSVFAKSCVDFIVQYDFDGVDIDWEYPGGGGKGGNKVRAQDPKNFTLFLVELRKQLDAMGKKRSRKYLLTIAAAADPVKAARLEIAKLAPILDWVNVMSFDYHGPWPQDPVTGFNTPLYPVKGDPTPPPRNRDFNCARSIDFYLSKGMPRQKLQLGLAFYGRGFGQVQSSSDGLFAKFSGPPRFGTWENGVFDYSDLEAKYIGKNGYVRRWNDEARAPYLFHSTKKVFISYDDVRSIREKLWFAKARGLGGVMFWEFSGDRAGVLLSEIDRSFRGQASLRTSADTILAKSPTRVQLHLSESASSARKVYVIVAGMSGTNPGLTLPGATLPIRYDSFSVLALGLTNSPLFPGFLGTLDTKGDASAAVDLRALSPLPAALIGRRISCAAWILTQAPQLAGRPSNAIDIFIR